MFKFLPLLVLGFVACSWSLPVGDADKKPAQVEIIKSVINKEVDGSYSISNESSDGTKREETATMMVDEDGHSYLEIQGYYTYINDVGEFERVDYTAGKNGFVPSGASVAKEITDTAAAAKDLPKFDPEAQYGA